MSLLKAIKAQLGLSNTATNNFTLTAEAADGTMKLARGNAGATTQDIITIDANGVVAFPQRAQLTLGTAVPTTSGTSVDLTGIPTWAKRVTLLLDSVSTNGTSQLLLQLGSGSIQTTGYESVGSYSGTAGQYDTETTGFVLEPPTGPAATGKRHGQIMFTATGSNRYIGSGICSDYGYGVSAACGGAVTLAGALDRLRITTLGAANTFDAGSIQVIYEG